MENITILGNKLLGFRMGTIMDKKNEKVIYSSMLSIIYNQFYIQFGYEFVDFRIHILGLIQLSFSVQIS